MRTLREYIDLVKRGQLDEGWWSNFKNKLEKDASEFELKDSLRYIDKLIDKAKFNQISRNALDHGGGWTSIVDTVWRSKDPLLKKLLDELEQNLRHWPENNTDIRRSNQLVEQLVLLQEKIKEFYNVRDAIDESSDDPIAKIDQLFRDK